MNKLIIKNNNNNEKTINKNNGNEKIINTFVETPMLKDVKPKK